MLDTIDCQVSLVAVCSVNMHNCRQLARFGSSGMLAAVMTTQQAACCVWAIM
jgi:hypothetical protein